MKLDSTLLSKQTALAALGLLTFACSPGGGGSGGGLSLCVTNPTLPGCPGTTDTGGDATASDSVTSDNGGPDVSSDTPGTDTGGQCTATDPRCNGNSVEACVDGTWTTIQTCGGGEICQGGACGPEVCTPNCAGKQCGDDGCGNSCGECQPGQTCNVDGQCQIVCVGNCAGKQCGDDGCGVSCGNCGPDEICNQAFQCETTVCQPTCGECGPDGCGGSCGNCPGGWNCQGDTCVQGACTPQCAGKVCGDDGCNGSCGSCLDPGDSCVNGQCQSLNPGGDNCNEILTCMGACNGDIPCEQTCQSAGSATGQSKLNAYLSCFGACADYQCLITNGCADEAAACFNEVSGFGGCNAYLQCFNTCGNGAPDSCYDACTDAASATAQALNIEINWCLLNICDAADTACIQAAAQNECLAYVDACLNN